MTFDWIIVRVNRSGQNLGILSPNEVTPSTEIIGEFDTPCLDIAWKAWQTVDRVHSPLHFHVLIPRWKSSP